MEDLLNNVLVDVATCESIERNIRGRAAATRASARKDLPTKDLSALVTDCVEACRESRKRYHEENGPKPDTSDQALSQYTRFTDQQALHVYKKFLWYTPRLVNIVTAETNPRALNPTPSTSTCLFSKAILVDRPSHMVTRVSNALLACLPPRSWQRQSRWLARESRFHSTSDSSRRVAKGATMHLNGLRYAPPHGKRFKHGI